MITVSKYSVNGSVVFSPEDSDLESKRWRADKSGYARRNIKTAIGNRSRWAHHDVCIRKFGRRPDWSKMEVCDHINRNRLDNRRENLRIVSIAENQANRAFPKPRLLNSGKWEVRIKRLTVKHLSRHDTLEQANLAVSNLELSNP